MADTPKFLGDVLYWEMMREMKGEKRACSVNTGDTRNLKIERDRSSSHFWNHHSRRVHVMGWDAEGLIEVECLSFVCYGDSKLRIETG